MISSRMRKLLGALSVLSAFLCVIAGVLWVRSYRRADLTYHVGEDRETWCVVSNWGAVTIAHREYKGLAGGDQGWTFYSGSADRMPFGQVRWSVVGFSRSGIAQSYDGPYAYTCQDEYFSIPFWFLVVVFAIPASLLAVRLLRLRSARRRMRLGLCLGCGYDLRGSDNRCPECGRPMTKPPSPTDQVHGVPSPTSAVLLNDLERDGGD